MMSSLLGSNGRSHPRWHLISSPPLTSEPRGTPAPPRGPASHPESLSACQKSYLRHTPRTFILAGRLRFSSARPWRWVRPNETIIDTLPSIAMKRRHTGLRWFIVNFTDLYRSKLGDRNAVYLLRLKLGLSHIVPPPLPPRVREVGQRFLPAGRKVCEALRHACKCNFSLVLYESARQLHDIQRAPNHAIASLCGLSACSKTRSVATRNM
jgi:hypothetical protein